MTTSHSDIRRIPLTALVLSKTGPQVARRAHFEKAELAELAESIAAHGVLQPIVVRAVTEEAARDKFEIIAGERRYLGAQRAGLSDIPALVGAWNDEQVLEVQLIENLQRVDLHPLQEAEGYEQLMKLHGHHADELGDKVGKSKGYVYARLKLLALGKDGRKSFYDGKLNASTALLLARIPDAELQKKALKEITTPKKNWGGSEGEQMSVREAAKHIQTEYMLRLSSAGFKTEDATLLPAAGACGPCPKRTGNQPELFGDVKGADVCTDVACFRAKIAAHAARVVAEAEKTGQKVLTGNAAKEVARYGVENHNLQGYVRLDAKDYSTTGGSRTYRQTLGKDFVPTLLQDPESGKMIEVAAERDVDKARGRKPERASSSNPEAAADKRRRRALAYRLALFQEIHKTPATDKDEILHITCEEWFERLDSDTQRRLFKALGWVPKKRTGKYVGGYDTDAKPYIDKMSVAERWTFLRALTLASDLPFFTYGQDNPALLHAAAKRYKVDAAKIRSNLAAAEKAKKPAKASKKRAARS